MGNGFSRSRVGTDSREGQARSENRGESRRIFDVLKLKNKMPMTKDDFYIDKVANILKEEYKDISEEHANLLKRKQVLELVKKIISDNKSSYKEIILSIHENMENLAEEGNINQNMYINLGEDMKCAFPEQSESNSRSAKSRVKDKINTINDKITIKEINIKLLNCNGEYQEYKRTVNGRINKYKGNTRKIEKEINRINTIQSTFCNPILYEGEGEFVFQEEMKDFHELQNKVMSKYYELSDAITRLGDETGLIPSKLKKNTHFYPGKKEIDCLHADDPDWRKYGERMKDLKGGFDSLGNARWHQDYQKKLETKLEKHWKNLDKLRGMDLNNSSEIEKCMEDVASLEEKINEDEQRYGFHPNIAEYRKRIQNLRVDLGKRFWEDEV